MLIFNAHYKSGGSHISLYPRYYLWIMTSKTLEKTYILCFITAFLKIKKQYHRFNLQARQNHCEYDG